ncbi:MAG: hypothetical protein V7L11_19385 [Nostoc sp.]|uniref:hypothetical protein n=1 Tax=Nostoc sp. TaxID=1180 RepID=UPI002FFC6A56
MEKIQQFLQPYNIEATDDEVANLCAQVDADIDQLTDQQAQAIAIQILELRLATGKLTTANGKSKNGMVTLPEPPAQQSPSPTGIPNPDIADIDEESVQSVSG